VDPNTWHRVRDRVARQITDEPGQHLVLVHYDPNHVVDVEWVYNEADVDGSRVVWTRAMNPQDDQLLVEYFQGHRRVWLLEADALARRLVPHCGEFSGGANGPP